MTNEVNQAADEFASMSAGLGTQSGFDFSSAAKTRTNTNVSESNRSQKEIDVLSIMERTEQQRK